MASIPLHCNICPSEPTFSDTSHLLTHIASKGHLSHYFKSQVKSRQDENVRHKVDIYDDWYKKNQIERLLSQRMSAKNAKPKNDTKRSTAKKQASRTPSINTKEQKSRGRRQNKKTSQVNTVALAPATSNVLDPQLSRPGSDVPGHYGLSRHQRGSQAPIPQMTDYPAISPDRTSRFNSQLSHLNATPISTLATDYDGEVDIIRSFIRSPTPSPHRHDALQSISTQLLRAANEASFETDLQITSPVLKGVRYPGMSLFDAASREAQRLRNQKKNNSITEQLQVDAAAIEPMEHIYWPEGHLKKSRVITGEVESSPMKEDTPPPAGLRRSRTDQELADFSTTAPLYIGRCGRETSSQELRGRRVDIMANDALLTLKSVFPRAQRLSPSLAHTGDEDEMRSLGSPLRRKGPTISVFRDSPAAETGSPLRSFNGERLDASLPIRSSPTRSSPWRALSQRLGPAPQQRSPVNPFGPGPKSHTGFGSPKSLLTPTSADDKENLPLPLGYEYNPSFHKTPERITQRYFSVVGDNDPQFYTTMPPAMDFGGLVGRSVFGSSINPLNAFAHTKYVQPDYLDGETEPPTPPGLLEGTKSKAIGFGGM